MSFTTGVIIFGILFWVLGALAMVSLLMWTYTQLVYLKWNREDREREELENIVVGIVNSEHSESEDE